MSCAPRHWAWRLEGRRARRHTLLQALGKKSNPAPGPTIDESAGNRPSHANSSGIAPTSPWEKYLARLYAPDPGRIVQKSPLQIPTPKRYTDGEAN